NPLNHRLGGVNLIGLMGGCRLNVNHNPGINVDQIVRRVGIECRAASGSPLRRRIGQRDLLRRALLDLSLVYRGEILARRAANRLALWPRRVRTRPPTLTLGIRFTQLSTIAHPAAPTGPSVTHPQ